MIWAIEHEDSIEIGKHAYIEMMRETVTVRNLQQGCPRASHIGLVSAFAACEGRVIVEKRKHWDRALF